VYCKIKDAKTFYAVDTEFLMKGFRLRLSKLLPLFFMTLSVCACSVTPVEPWQKGNLAKPEMTFEADVLDKNFTEHTYFSKEGAFGGAGVGGGGCGCN
jgi:Domain of unknown function (DUF4266)